MENETSLLPWRRHGMVIVGPHRPNVEVIIAEMNSANPHHQTDADFLVHAVNMYTRLVDVIKEAEAQSRKRLPIKKETWLKMVELLART